MELKELFQHVVAIKEYCENRDMCVGCPLDGNVCLYGYDVDITPENWNLLEEYFEEEE